MGRFVGWSRQKVWLAAPPSQGSDSQRFCWGKCSQSGDARLIHRALAARAMAVSFLMQGRLGLPALSRSAPAMLATLPWSDAKHSGCSSNLSLSPHPGCLQKGQLRARSSPKKGWAHGALG